MNKKPSARGGKGFKGSVLGIAGGLGWWEGERGLEVASGCRPLQVSQENQDLEMKRYEKYRKENYCPTVTAGRERGD